MALSVATGLPFEYFDGIDDDRLTATYAEILNRQNGKRAGEPGANGQQARRGARRRVMSG